MVKAITEIIKKSVDSISSNKDTVFDVGGQLTSQKTIDDAATSNER